MSLITCKAKPNNWDDWCAQPGTDALGYPWSSWIHGGPMCNCPTGECKFGRQRAEEKTTPAPIIPIQFDLFGIPA